MTVLRAFIAIEIPTEIKQQMIAQTADLRQKLGRSVRWVTAENTHLTLKFLGDIPPIAIDSLTRMLKEKAEQTPPFEIAVVGLGAFPNLHHPRVIWVGLNAPATLTELQKTLDAATTHPEHSPDKLAFSPHLTIGRVRQPLSDAEKHSLPEALQNTQIGWLGNFTVQSISLFQSELKSAGPIYTCLSTVQLGG
jgi:2'-5' RNA ligase